MKLGIDGSEPEWCEIGGDINVEFIDPAGFPHGLLPRDECLQLFHQLLHLAIDIYYYLFIYIEGESLSS